MKTTKPVLTGLGLRVTLALVVVSLLAAAYIYIRFTDQGSVYQAFPAQSAQSALLGVSTMPTGTPIPSAENIPVYPGARQIEVPLNQRVKDARVTLFEINASPEDVAAFYKSTLPKDGWELLDERPDVQGSELPQDRDYLGLTFAWSDREGIVPWRYHLDMPIGRREIAMYLRRIPNIHKIPLYPGAENVAVQDTGNADAVRRITTTYTTSASPSEVEAYYRDVLPQYAWLAAERQGENISGPDGIAFGVTLDSSRMMRFVEVNIIARSDVGGQTTVELRARQSGLGEGD